MSYSKVIIPLKYETENDGVGKLLYQKILLKKNSKKEFQSHNTNITSVMKYRCCFKLTLITGSKLDITLYNNNNNIYLLHLGCYPVAVVILHVYKT